MKEITIPKFLHDIFGEHQSLLELLLTVIFGLGFTTLILITFLESNTTKVDWKTIVAFILIFDVAAGCVANVTRGTNNYYSERPKNRIVFICVHIHLVLIGPLLNLNIVPVLAIWAYTIITAFVINSLKNWAYQKILGFFLLFLGLGILLVLGEILPGWFQLTSALFLTKVLYSFAVDHYHNPKEVENA